MKRATRWGLWGILTLALCADLFLTPTGALRLGVALSGHPIKAFAIRAQTQQYPQSLTSNQIGYKIKNPPFEPVTGSELKNWVVTKNGMYYTASYYGNG